MKTVGRIDPGRTAKIRCVRSENCENMPLQGRMFMLLLVLEGVVVLRTQKGEVTAVAPSFVAFNEQETPALVRKSKLRAMAVYFHPQFLNVNMTFDLLRSEQYQDIASVHDMFMLTPFVNGSMCLPIMERYLPRVMEAFDDMELQLTEQPDLYWSCRARAGFMNLLMVLETHYQLKLMGKLVVDHQPKSITHPIVKRAVFFIETHYMDKITCADIVADSGSNRTTLSRLCLEQLGMTAVEYLRHYRIETAQKLLRFTESPVKDIASQCGFSTAEHFTRVFTEMTGTPPASFRKNAVEKRKNEFRHPSPAG